MKLQIRTAFVILLFLAFPHHARAQEVAAPVFQDGDSWQFKIDSSKYTASVQINTFLNGTYEVVFRGGEFKIFEMKGSDKTEIADSLGMLLTLFGKGNWHGGQFLSFPLSVGKKWAHEYRAPYLGDRTPHSWHVEINVTGKESVTTPTGTFDAFKIQNYQSTESKITFNYLYSPETKSIVKLSFLGKTGSGAGGKTDITLIQFTPRK